MASSTDIYLCPECGMPAGGILEATSNPHILLLVINEHDCNPHVIGMFNADSQHNPPFQR